MIQSNRNDPSAYIDPLFTGDGGAGQPAAGPYWYYDGLGWCGEMETRF
jgi:hypothetical protein